MIFGKNGSVLSLGPVLLCLALFSFNQGAAARTPIVSPSASQLSTTKASPPKKSAGQDDSFIPTAPKDLTLTLENARKADALADFVEGVRLEENAEMDNALAAYEKVLTFDPGLSDLALRVASLLSRQGDYPRAIDVLKDAIKVKPKEPGPYLQLAFIYAKYLRKSEQAVKYANQAITLDPLNFEAYQRLYEIEAAAGQPQKALEALDRAANVKSEDPGFWIRLGKLYATIVFKSEPKPDEIKRVNGFFERAVANAGEDSTALKDVADYYAASQQIQEAIPLYLKVLELQPDDLNAREKLATGFVLTNQRDKAIAMLQDLISKQPAKYQPYDLLAQLLDESARALERANQSERAKAQFAKAAANYEQSLLINPARANTYLRLAELLIVPLRDSDRASRVLTEARQRFPGVPEITYFLAIAQREAKRPQQAVITFEEALNEAQLSNDEVLNARFYFDYGAAADQAGFYDKAADLMRKSISLDPANSAEACNYIAFMWADHNMHLDEAEEMVGRALEFDPNNGAFLDTLGWVHYRKGKYEDALSELLRAEQNLSRPDPVVFEHIGDVYAKMDRNPQAVDFWQKAAALSPENKLLAEKIEKTRTMISKGPPGKINR
ncbi:MAG TPA: tetratricopeptide repeat protein [Chthoniobacterales bacterium]|jgi:tetratricopeptide (TPR) repeat protein|nr:tetratricopeptide repeat protein [Chthoniobacterales bacterium]